MATQTYWTLAATVMFVTLILILKSLIASDVRLTTERSSAACAEFKDRAAHLQCSGRIGFGR